jgi:hypothetical protein
MFSAKQLLDNLHPYERSALINYIVRPYIIKIGTEVGISFTGHGKLRFSTEDLFSVVIKQIRLLHKEKQGMKRTISNQKKEIERRAQLVFQFMEKNEKV